MQANDFLTRGEQVYTSPQVNIFHMCTEGVMCASLDVPGAGYDDENDLGEI
jgi:hypothetical protein